MVACGPDIKDVWSLKSKPHIFDITPTILHLFGRELNDRFDGYVLEVLDIDRTPVFSSYNDYRPDREDIVSRREEDILEERLWDMGYLG